MKEKSTEKFNAINKDAVVGSSRTFKIDIPGPSNSTPIKKSAPIKRTGKKRKCSGCSRNRKIG